MIHLLQPTNENWQFEMMIVSMVAEVLPAGLGRERRTDREFPRRRKGKVAVAVRQIGRRAGLVG